MVNAPEGFNQVLFKTFGWQKMNSSKILFSCYEFVEY